MRPAFAHSVNARLDHVRGCLEVRLANFQVNDALALMLERTRFVQNFEGRSRYPVATCGELGVIRGR